MIQTIKETCESQSKVGKFLGACAFYQKWIPHYDHIADPLYTLLRKGKRFEWGLTHTSAMQKLKEELREASSLKKPDYKRPVVVTVDTSPTGIGWVINQMNDEDFRDPIRFGAKVLNKKQCRYA